MSINALIAIRSLTKNKFRTIATLLGVILATFLITSILVLISSLLTSLVTASIHREGDWHVAIRDVSVFKYDQLKEKGGIEQAGIISCVGYAELEDLRLGSEYKPYIYITSVSKNWIDMMPLNLVKGTFPKKDDEIILSQTFENTFPNRYKIGDQIYLNTGTRVSVNQERLNQLSSYLGENSESVIDKKPHKYKIVGVYEQTPLVEMEFSPGYGFITFDNSLHESGNTIYIKLKDPKQAYEYAKDIIDEEHYYCNKDLLSNLGISNNNENMKKSIITFAVILLVIIVATAIFLISNSFSISVRDRVKQYGLLISLGASNKQLKKIVWYEGCFIGLIGIPIGILLGIMSIILSLNTIGEIVTKAVYGKLEFRISISPILIFLIFLLCMACILFSTYIPAKKTGRISAIEAIRQNDKLLILDHGKLRKGRDWNVEKVLVQRNQSRFGRKYRSSILSIGLGISLICIADVFATYAGATLEKELSVIKYDIQCSINEDNLINHIVDYRDRLSMIEGVESVHWKCDIGYGEGKFLDSNSVYVIIDDKSFLSLLERNNMDSKEFFERKKPRILAYSNKVDQYLNKVGIRTISDECFPVELEAYKEYDDLVGIIPYSMVKAFGISNISFMECYISAPDHETVSDNILSVIGKDKASVMDVAASFEPQKNMLVAGEIFSEIFIVIIWIIATLNVIMTIFTGIMIRKKEFAILQSVGMGKNGLRKMMVYEGAILARTSILLGIMISFLISLLLYLGVAKDSGLPLFFPFYSMFYSVIGVIGLLGVISVCADYYIERINLSESIRDDRIMA